MAKKSDLIQNDPVTCAHHFDHMVHLLINNFIIGEHKPIGDVQDFFTGLNFSNEVLNTYMHYFGLKMHLYMVQTHIQKWLPLLINMFHVVTMLKTFTGRFIELTTT